MTHKLLGIATEKDELPAPLGPGEPVRRDEAGARLWNPDWEGKITVALNRDFVQEVAAKTIQHEDVSPYTI